MNKSKLKKTLAGVFATAILAVGVAVPAGAAFPGYIGSTQNITLTPGHAAAQATGYEGKHVSIKTSCNSNSYTTVSYRLTYSQGASAILAASGTVPLGGEIDDYGQSTKSTFWQYVIYPTTGTNASGTGEMTIDY